MEAARSTRRRRAPEVPVTMGSPRFTERDTANAHVIGAWFPPDAVLHPHRHDRAIFGVMLDGSFESRIAGRALPCSPSSVWTEPCEEIHANYVGRFGASVLVVQPDHRRAELFDEFRPLLTEVAYTRSAEVSADARRIVAELQEPDRHTSLVIDALILTMFVNASRRRSQGRHHLTRPPWLRCVLEYAHEHFRDRIELSTLARIAGVHASHFAHVFRACMGITPGDHLRALRLEWAVSQLRTSAATISGIAHAAGYSDQSHFTRQFRRVYGTTPALYRKSMGYSPSQ
jgi:AraC family transcriptional regulator